jgi:hypothetical protein
MKARPPDDNHCTSMRKNVPGVIHSGIKDRQNIHSEL